MVFKAFCAVRNPCPMVAVTDAVLDWTWGAALKALVRPEMAVCAAEVMLLLLQVPVG